MTEVAAAKLVELPHPGTGWREAEVAAPQEDDRSPEDTRGSGAIGCEYFSATVAVAASAASNAMSSSVIVPLILPTVDCPAVDPSSSSSKLTWNESVAFAIGAKPSPPMTAHLRSEGPRMGAGLLPERNTFRLLQSLLQRPITGGNSSTCSSGSVPGSL